MIKKKNCEMRIITGLVGMICLLQWTACTKTYSTVTDTSFTPTQTSQSLLDYLKNNYNYSIFYAGLKKVGLDKQINGTTKYTLLVPDNDAFGRINITQDSLMNMDTAYLRKWLGFHIIQGAIGYDSIPKTVDNVYFSILGQKIFFSKPVSASNTSQVLHINGTNVNNFDIQASNGYIQVLDTPLNAPLEGTLQDYINAHLDQFSLFKACLQKFNLWDNLKNDTSSQMTVFAPVNTAFQNLSLFSYSLQAYYTYTITQDTIAAWDTQVIPQDVFGAYLIPSRIFTSDFTDDPASGGSSGIYASYILPDKGAAVTFSIWGQSLSAQLLTGYEQQLRGAGSGATIISPGNWVTENGNNVIQPVNAVLMIP
jgi:uncharacterized surface protein with fasciclin (FAS1) repeats